MEKELGREVDFGEIKEKIRRNFARVFNVEINSVHGRLHQEPA